MPDTNVKEFLDNQGIDYEIILHRPAVTAEATATASHIPKGSLAKTVVVRVDGAFALAVVPASQRVDLQALRTATRASSVALASESEFQDKFPHCEPGAMPPFGNVYGMATFVDEEIAKQAQITFNAGCHTELVRVAYKDFARFVAPRVMTLALRPVLAKAA